MLRVSGALTAIWLSTACLCGKSSCVDDPDACTSEFPDSASSSTLVQKKTAMTVDKTKVVVADWVSVHGVRIYKLHEAMRIETLLTNPVPASPTDTSSFIVRFEKDVTTDEISTFCQDDIVDDMSCGLVGRPTQGGSAFAQVICTPIVLDSWLLIRAGRAAHGITILEIEVDSQQTIDPVVKGTGAMSQAGATSTTTTTTVKAMIPGSWAISGNGCTQMGSSCVTSLNWPQPYGDNERCEISIGTGVFVTVHSFATENHYDMLSWNRTEEFSGKKDSRRPSHLPGNDYANHIQWETDSSLVDGGWKICLGDPPPRDWVVVLKVSNDNTFGYSSPLWENSELLNESSPINEPVNAKYESYLTTSFHSIRMCVGSPDSNCVEHTFTKEWASAKDLFSAGYISDTELDRDGILDVFAPTTGSYRDCPMQSPGFNIKCDGENWARIGYCNNCPSQACQNSDDDDADASIGIGLRGQSTYWGDSSEMGAGWTHFFASGEGNCDPNSMTYKDVWLWVK